jgi:hypothetical protein
MEGRTDGSVTISLRNFVGEGIISGLCLKNAPLHLLKTTIEQQFTRSGYLWHSYCHT